MLVVSAWGNGRLCRYRVELKDKTPTTYSLDRPWEFLSQKALERRKRQCLKVDSTDIPVCDVYLKALSQVGVKVVGTSKWNNTVLLELSDTSRIADIRNLPFVADVIKVWTCPDSLVVRNVDRKMELESESFQSLSNYYGNAQIQVEMLRIDQLHYIGYRGQNMTIAVIDGGFLNADVLPLLKNVKIEGVRNFVNPDRDVYAEIEHGTSVLSCMAVNAPNLLVGTAPEASYWLLCSEDNDGEFLVEEDYWAQAIEFADSVGVDVVNTSLGYYAFDEVSSNYCYRDLNGKTSLMSRSASMAADKGMLIVCSAGNTGMGTWKKITLPADADNVLAVGAVDTNRMNAVFSALGNTSDGRTKPDVMALGVDVYVASKDGSISAVQGTSFASPLICGAVACLWQACPHFTAKEIIWQVRQCADRSDSPDNVFGYGIPDFWKAYQQLSIN